MIQLVDTHTHLYLPEFDSDRDDVVRKASAAGVTKLLMPNIDAGSVGKMISLEKKYPDLCYSMIGLHPTSVRIDYQDHLELIGHYLNENRFIAIGEIGIDLYWDKTFAREQTDAFKMQVGLAISKGLPVVIHSREAFDEIFKSLEEFRGSGIKGVFHAFSGTVDQAGEAINMGFKIGIGGIVTFKNSGLDLTVKEIGAENIVLETDSPYLAPVPYRGKRNESSYIRLINGKVAEILNMSFEEVAEKTTANALELFSL
jgi:TatD DNase family protein